MEGYDRHMRQDRESMLGSKDGREEVDYRDTPVSKYGCFTLIRVSNYDWIKSPLFIFQPKISFIPIVLYILKPETLDRSPSRDQKTPFLRLYR